MDVGWFARRRHICVPNHNVPAFQPIHPIEQRDLENLTRIATEESRRQSTLGHRLISLAACDLSLDLQSPTFDLRKWLVAGMIDAGSDGHRDQNMGSVFKQPNVYRSGAALRFQDTVSSILSAPLRVPRGA